ncbi:MAG: hypothetical protein RXO28_06740 [Thermocladium sp.]
MQQDAVAKAINILERLDELGVLDSMQSLLSDEELPKWGLRGRKASPFRAGMSSPL